MKIIKVDNCRECPIFDEAAYLENKSILCGSCPKIIFKCTKDIYITVHQNCPLEDAL